MIKNKSPGQGLLACRKFDTFKVFALKSRFLGPQSIFADITLKCSRKTFFRRTCQRKNKNAQIIPQKKILDLKTNLNRGLLVSCFLCSRYSDRIKGQFLLYLQSGNSLSANQTDFTSNVLPLRYSSIPASVVKLNRRRYEYSA